MSTRVTYRMITKEGYVGWRNFLDVFKRFHNKTGRTIGGTRRRLRELAKLGRQLHALQEEYAAKRALVQNTCSHPVQYQAVVKTGRRDEYGSWSTQSRIEVLCDLCSKSLGCGTEDDNRGEITWDVPF